MRTLDKRYRLAGIFILCIFIGNAPSLLFATEQQTPAVQVEKNVAATMRDGVRLYADIYRPATAVRVPVILVRTPYNKDQYAEYSSFPRSAAESGYAAIIQDGIGRFSSEGVFSPSLHELNDGFDSVEWAAALPFSTGKGGMQGCSYLGAVQWQGR